MHRAGPPLRVRGNRGPQPEEGPLRTAAPSRGPEGAVGALRAEARSPVEVRRAEPSPRAEGPPGAFRPGRPARGLPRAPAGDRGRRGAGAALRRSEPDRTGAPWRILAGHPTPRFLCAVTAVGFKLGAGAAPCHATGAPDRASRGLTQYDALPGRPRAGLAGRQPPRRSTSSGAGCGPSGNCGFVTTSLSGRRAQRPPGALCQAPAKDEGPGTRPDEVTLLRAYGFGPPDQTGLPLASLSVIVTPPFRISRARNASLPSTVTFEPTISS